VVLADCWSLAIIDQTKILIKILASFRARIHGRRTISEHWPRRARENRKESQRVSRAFLPDTDTIVVRLSSIYISWRINNKNQCIRWNPKFVSNWYFLYYFVDLDEIDLVRDIINQKEILLFQGSQ